MNHLLQMSFCLCMLFLPAAIFASGEISLGQQIALGKGNCIVCHQLADVPLAGNIGPPLRNLKQRYPNKYALRNQIWDPQQLNPRTVMPPYGRHQILSEAEIDALVDYLYTSEAI